MSRNVIGGAIHFVSMLLSIPVIGSGIWLSTLPDNSCVKVLQCPVIILGVAILAVSIAGFIGGFWGIPWLRIFNLFGMLLLILLLACLVVFIYMVTLKGSGHLVPTRAYLEYSLDDYSGWLQTRVRSSHKLDRIRSCLSSSANCAELNNTYYQTPQNFFGAHISPMQSGCCKPPTECGHTFVSPTYWTSPVINNATNMDCSQWCNEQTQLCYSCDSCKAGLLANLKNEWGKINIILIITLVALISVYLLGCCAFRDVKTEVLQMKFNSLT